MSMRSRRVRHGLVASVVVLLMTGLRLPMLAQRAPEPGPQGKAGGLTTNFDIRSSAALRTQLLQRLGRSQPEDGATKLRRANDALATLRSDLPRATATISPVTGGAELVRNPRGALTPPAPGTASAAIVSGFLETHAALYGLAPADLATIRFLGESVNRSNGLRMLRAEQAIDGIPVFQSDARFILDREGRLIRTTGRLVSPAGAGGSAPAAAIPASAALVSAMRSVGNPPVIGDVASRLVYFPLASGVLVLAYEQMTYTDGPGDYLTVVDATTGTLLWRKNVRNYQVGAAGALQRVRAGRRRHARRQPGAAVTDDGHARGGHAVPRDSSHDRQHAVGAGPDGQPERLDPRWRHHHDGQQRGRLPRPRRWSSSQRLRHRRPRRRRPAGGQPRCVREQPRLSRERHPQLRLLAVAARRQSGRRRHADRDHRGTGRVPARRRDAALLPHELVPRPPLPPRVRRGGRQLPDGELQRPGCRRRCRAGGCAGRIGDQQRQLLDAA